MKKEIISKAVLIMIGIFCLTGCSSNSTEQNSVAMENSLETVSDNESSEASQSGSMNEAQEQSVSNDSTEADSDTDYLDTESQNKADANNSVSRNTSNSVTENEQLVAETVESNQESEASTDRSTTIDSKDIDNQIATIIKEYNNISSQYDTSEWHYAIVDLDQDGWLELIGCSSILNTSMIHDNVFYEVGEDGTWTELQTPMDMVSSFISDSTTTLSCYFEPNSSEYYYYISEYSSMPSGGGGGTWYYTLHYQDNELIWEHVKDEEFYSTCNEQFEPINIYTYRDTNENICTQEEYEAIEQIYFQGYEQMTCNISWISATDMQEQKVKTSWESFSLSHALSTTTGNS